MTSQVYVWHYWFASHTRQHVQGNTQDELPEVLIGTCRVNHMDASEAFVVKP